MLGFVVVVFFFDEEFPELFPDEPELPEVLEPPELLFLVVVSVLFFCVVVSGAAVVPTVVLSAVVLSLVCCVVCSATVVFSAVSSALSEEQPASIAPQSANTVSTHKNLFIFLPPINKKCAA